MEGQAEQAALVVLGIEPDESIGEVEPRTVLELTVAQQEDLAGLVDDEGGISHAARADQRDRRDKSVRDELEADVRGPSGGGGRRLASRGWGRRCVDGWLRTGARPNENYERDRNEMSSHMTRSRDRARL
jgi:hypothetical protein